MEKESKILRPTDGRPAYEAPRALRLDGPHTGEGGITPTCTTPGSSAVGDCGSGASATGWCYVEGNSADYGCDTSGNTAGTACYGDGNTATTECNTVGNSFA
ncbi:MAG: hypothetical protein KKB13_04405 [Chloroflexi bacterium]|nr:hypothetical protein [Chloroflexota bacterium]